MTLTAICLHDLVIRRVAVFHCKTCGKRVEVKKASKYHNERITIDNIVFDSRREGRRYLDLKFMEQMAVIKSLELQPRFDFCIDGVLMFSYYADFKYYDAALGWEIIEDCKGERLPLYRLKKKLIEAQHKIRIIET